MNKGDLQKFWVDTLGLTKINTFKSERENVDEDVLECGRGILGKVEVDIMTPLDPEKSPKVHIPPLNHIGLWVDDLPKCVEHLESKNIKDYIILLESGVKIVGGIRKGASGFDVTFVHPKSACGVLLELVQAPADVIEAWKAAK